VAVFASYVDMVFCLQYSRSYILALTPVFQVRVDLDAMLDAWPWTERFAPLSALECSVLTARLRYVLQACYHLSAWYSFPGARPRCFSNSTHSSRVTRPSKLYVSPR
jgi:hypothetical protein